MDTQAKPQDQLVFHLSGRRTGDALTAIDGLDLRPALLAPYRDMGALRHDFPLVLAARPASQGYAQTLADMVDAVLAAVAPRGIEGERLRRHALQVETEVRRAVDAGAEGTLAELWRAAALRVAEGSGSLDETLQQVLELTGGALRGDGAVLGCNAAMPAQLLTHAWRHAQRAKAKRFRTDLARLVQKLSDILRAAYSHSQAGRAPQALRAAVGGPHRDQFDFSALSRVVGKGAPRDELPAARRARLVRTLGVLEAQRFWPQDDDEPGADVLGFAFDNCDAAANAFRERLEDLTQLVKALAIAELEVRGAYVESEHAAFFDAFDAHALTTDDLARFPDYLVCIPPERSDAPENASLLEMLSSGLPVKVLVQTGDLLEDSSIGTGRFAFGVRSARLATTAMGLGGMFVLQAASSSLHTQRERIAQGLAASGPALFSVYAATRPEDLSLPPYLAGAVATHARAFPSFCYDAAAGGNWASRFTLADNPQPDADWAVETLEYADDKLQRVREHIAFTFADFALADRRHAGHFALVPRSHWGSEMLPAADWLALPEAEAAQRVPYLLTVDAQDKLQRVIVDARLMQAARRCQLLWRRLQEHAGINDSHAVRLLAEREAQAVAAAAAPVAAAPAAAPAAKPAADAGTAAEAAPARSRDEAWIDTPRCPSCNECQLINDRMFGYDERKQAFIKDLAAGSYRQLVEAAESCQVAIIHPGKPRDPNEPGLEELLARAEPFR
ncbi:conserved hypothetical protein [Rubrivivax sp. A210]|uniref:ferredoxin n=1 Tax=Rubrivivax sp. A210 TaxID=2772301 RepID=UPI0019181B23|nr:hypothetical protein [Rubrivivax sp. A210]CAD5375067.1 conserved hypothetical protein [Rubrivivax sp. A210]